MIGIFLVYWSAFAYNEVVISKERFYAGGQTMSTLKLIGKNKINSHLWGGCTGYWGTDIHNTENYATHGKQC